MTGRNVLILNHETMKEAVDYWLRNKVFHANNYTLGRGVESVAQSKDAAGQRTFEVIVNEKLVKGQADPTQA